MLLSGRRVRSLRKARVLVLVALIVLQLSSSFSPSQANVIGKQVWRAATGAVEFLHDSFKPSKTDLLAVMQGRADELHERKSQVSKVSLCPRRLLLYAGEEFILTPLPLDSNGQPVQGVEFAWQTSEPSIAGVKTDGTVIAVRGGHCVVTASVGQKQAKVKVEVQDGLRPRLTNAQWDVEHLNDCSNPEQDLPETLQIESNSPGSPPSPIIQVSQPPDPNELPGIPTAGARFNATGHPRFSPNLPIQASTSSGDNQLGSSSFNLNIPIFGSDGRGVGVGLALVYNSRMWTKDPDASKIIFDYDQGWPAPGFRLNYGRIIQDYNVAAGQSGDHLLLEADGTRTPLINKGSGVYRSEEGRYIEFSSSSKRLFLPNGSTIKYDTPNGSKLLPISIKDVHGNSISISYVFNCADALRVEPCTCGTNCSRPPRQAIKQITDTLGRIVTFHYYANGHLAEVHAPGYNGAPDRVIAKFSYQTITLSYNFSLTVSSAPAGGQVDVLRRVYFPETGRGYVFDNYSGYGMCTKASMRLGMTDASDGTEVAYTEYGFNTTGQLSDAPEFTQRKEWWQGKTDDAGNPVLPSSPATFDYSRTSNSSTMTNTISGPNNIASVMVSNNNSNSSQYGLVTEQRIEVGGTVKSKQEFFYSNPSSASGSSGLQRNEVIITDDGSPANQTRVDSIYGSYGRLETVIEYGFPVSGDFKKRRRTKYTYLDTSPYITAGLYHLATDVTVWDAKLTNDNADDEEVARTGFEYDNPGTGWGLVNYGFTNGCAPPTCTPPPGYDTSFVNSAARGLATKALQWSNAKGSTAAMTPADISFRHQYDIFGNEVMAEVGCCSLKRSSFSGSIAGMYYSLPLSITDGPISGPNLTNSFGYDFNTSFLKSQTDPNNLVTGYAPDAAMRVRTITYPKLLTDTNPNPTLETFYADPNYPNKDGLVYQSRFTYQDGAAQKVQISNQWLDAAGHVIRVGSAVGPTPTSFDVIKTIYDEWGRLRKTTNPYTTTDPNGDTVGLPMPIVYDYDSLSRVTTVTLPDSHTVTTVYSGAVTTMTDQVGRQRQSEVDGLGRTIRVTEMDSAKQLTHHTLYSYNLNNNLTLVNQGNQTRAFKYDSLSRVTFERTPEQTANINDGTGTLWSAKYTYTSFNAMLTRQDARGVITTYGYDGLNRLSTVSYNTAAAPGVEDTPNVAVTYGSVVPKRGQIEEISQTSGSFISWKETYQFDSLSRVNTRTVLLNNQTVSYPISYIYNQAGQVKRLTYPSGRTVDPSYDTRGRPNTLGGTRNYITGMSYKPSQQIESVNLANGVVEEYDYSPDRLQLISQNITKDAANLLSLTYNYEADSASGGGTHAGNSGQLVDIIGSITKSGIKDQTFKYDETGRLVEATGWGLEAQWQRRYTYDRWGNRTKVESKDTGSWCTKQTVDIKRDPNGVPGNNRATNVQEYVGCNPTPGKAMNYDSAGNLTVIGAQKNQYDAESRLAMAGTLSGGTAQYGYDASNRRVKKTSGGVTTNYVWEGSRIIAEYNDTTGAVIAEYVYAGGRLIARESGGAVTYYHQDRLSVRMLTDAQGAWEGTQSQEPFGEQVVERDLFSKWRFTTYERDDETGTDYAVNRQYQTGTGRFMQPDILAGSTTTPQSLNRYAYSGNDPVDFTDPNGLIRLDWVYIGGSFFLNPNFGWDGAPVSRELMGLLQHAWANGFADIKPQGAILNRRGDGWIVPVGEDDSIDLSDLNDLLRLVSLQVPTTYTGGKGSNPCAGVKASDLDYSKEQKYREGKSDTRMSAGDHILLHHGGNPVVPGENYYLTKPMLMGDAMLDHIKGLNAITFLAPDSVYQEIGSRNFVFTKTFPTAPHPDGSGKLMMIGFNRRTNSPTLTNKLVLLRDCKTVRTSFPN